MNRPKRRSSPGSPEEWLEFAESDLALARLASQAETIRAEHVCFHAQQAAEKAIKAVLRARGVEFPLTHDLELLLDLLEECGVRLPEKVRAAVSLTPYAVETRYPGFHEEISSAEVGEALGVAEEVTAWARQTLSDPGRVF